MTRVASIFAFVALTAVGAEVAADAPDERFEALATRFVDELPALSPVNATNLGDHRYDDKLDEISAAARIRQASFYRKYLLELQRIPWVHLSDANKVDAELMMNRIRGELWRQEQLREWQWNPLIYTGLAGGAIYALMARDFAPLPERLVNAAARLEAMPRFLDQVRDTLKPELVPQVHAHTAIRQNPGLDSIIANMIEPQLDNVDADLAKRLRKAISKARRAVNKHQRWLEKDLLPKAAGDFRIGAELFDTKLSFTLHTPLSRAQIRERAENEFRRVRNEMYAVAKQIYARRYPYTIFPVDPDDAFVQAVIRVALEDAYAELPGRDEIVDVVRQYLDDTTEFVREKDLVTVPDDPIEIIIMPEFQRGVAVAYCDSPGPLAAGQKTFYAVAPLPEEWTDAQVTSFLREYNLYSLQDLTIHEAMPGHYLQLALSNRYPSTLRALLYSGPFVEGWAVYAERVMIEAGYMDFDPLMRLINLKWYLRAVTNAIIDQAIHVDGMTRDEAMQLMIEGGFQEEREAAGKWTRAQLTSAQLSTYFVGYQEHADLRAEVEVAWGEDFSLRRYHDTVLAYGSPPVQFVRALVLGLDVPRTQPESLRTARR